VVVQEAVLIHQQSIREIGQQIEPSLFFCRPQKFIGAQTCEKPLFSANFSRGVGKEVWSQ
jgi:hypothetical protein